MLLRKEAVKAKDKRLPDRQGLVAVIPPELFTTALRERLVLAGFRKSRSRDGDLRDSVVWRLPATVAPLPLHLIRSLEGVAHVQPTRDLAEDLRFAVEGSGGQGGKGALSVSVLGPFFCANCDEGDKRRRAFLEAAGLFPLFAEPPGPRQAPIVKVHGSYPYVTQESVIAINLFPWMTPDAKKALIERAREDKHRAARSEAKERIKSDPVLALAEGEELQGFQDAGVNNLLKTRKSGVIYDDMGLGKALGIDSVIKTPNGNKLMKDIKIGDEVIGRDGKPVTVKGVYPQGEVELFRVKFHDGASVECCDQHLWTVRVADDPTGIWRVMPLGDIRNNMKDDEGNFRYEIPLVEPVDYQEKSLPCDPYEMGTVLALSKDNDIFLPPIFLLASIRQRQELLRGLTLGSSVPNGKGLFEFSATSKALIDDVAQLVMSLGGTAEKQHISPLRPHKLIISLPGSTRPSRFFSSVERVGMKPAQCIAVDARDHLYVTDDFIVTHNTVQGIAYANARPELPRILVVCKANMKQGWAKSFARFGVRDHNPFIIEGISTEITDEETGETRPYLAPELVNEHDLFIINYDLLTAHADFIRNTRWDLVILDEIHSVSNEDAQRTQVLFGDFKDPVHKPVRLALSKDGVIIGLSGTPHPVIERMWPILSSLRPDLFGAGPVARRAFINRYAPPTLFVKEFHKGNRSFKKILAIPGKLMREAELNRRLRGSGFMTRRLKADMADLLPPKSRAAIELPFVLTPDEIKELSQLEGQIAEVAARVAERARDGEATKIREGRAEAVINVVHGLHPKSPEFHEISRLRARIGEIKAPYVARYVIEECEGEEDLPADVRPKTVIFAHHKAVLGRIREELEAAFPGEVIVYDGSVTSDKKRYELEQRFQNDDKVRFFLMSLSGASGITLTRANRLYMAEMDWDPTNLPQIEDRIWRITQEQPCFIYYFMLVNSLDAQMGNRLIQRMQENRAIYDKVDLSGEAPRKPRAQKKKNDGQGVLAL